MDKYGKEAGSMGKKRFQLDQTPKASLQMEWLIFSIVAYIIMMVLMYIPLPGLTHTNMPGIMMLFATVTMLDPGMHFFICAYESIKNRFATMDVLISLGVLSAYIYGTLAVLGVFSMLDHNFFMIAVMLISFSHIGEYGEEWIKRRAGKVLQKFSRLQAHKVRVMPPEGKEFEVSVSSLYPGDRITIRQGEIIPVDGEVLEGVSSVDESSVTGKSMPVVKQKGDRVTGTTINKTGVLVVKTTGTGEETVLSQTIHRIKDAQMGNVQYGSFVNKVSHILVPIAISLSIITFACWYFLFYHYAGVQYFTWALKMAFAVLIITCPCSLCLVTPITAIVSSIRGLGRSIIIKQSSALENIAQLNVIVLDKTGTITQGRFEVTDIVSTETVDESELLTLVAAGSAFSNHPIAQSVVEEAKKRTLAWDTVYDFHEEVGNGVICRYKGKDLFMGNKGFMISHKIIIEELQEEMKNAEIQGKSLLYVAYDHRLIGILGLMDKIKQNVPDVIMVLKRMNIRIVMVTGDNEQVAKLIASEAGIEEYRATVLPEEKREIIKDFQKQGMKVGMVGDGINDAPALAQADVGIVIGAGADIAKEISDIVLIRNDMTDVVRAIQLGQKTLSKIKQNIFWAFFYNILGIPIAAGILYPFWGISLKPEYAELTMVLSFVSIGINSFLKRGKIV